MQIRHIVRFVVLGALPLLAGCAGGIPGMGSSQRAAVHCTRSHGTVMLGMGTGLSQYDPSTVVQKVFERSGCFTVEHQNVTAMEMGHAARADFAADVLPISSSGSKMLRNGAIGGGGMLAMGLAQAVPGLGLVADVGAAAFGATAAPGMQMPDVRIDVQNMRTGRHTIASGDAADAANKVLEQMFPGEKGPRLAAR